MTSIAHAARPFRRLLDYVPDDVILDAASREFVMDDGYRCVAGWVLRGVLARIVNKTAERIDLERDATTIVDSWDDGKATEVGAPTVLAVMVGGRLSTWEKLFTGVTHPEGAVRYDGRPYPVSLPMIEYAFVRRLAEAVERTSGR